jgi:mono/diheme cytochrome c family protein
MTLRFTFPFGAVALAAAVALHAQEPARTVADGVYGEAQAVRGSASYDAACARCHRADLTGADGPELRGERFARNFAGKNLEALYTKVATTMPRGAGGSLSDDVYLDLVAHLLRENGFPAGSTELKSESLEDIRVLPGRPKPPPPVGDFSYVEVVGCLTTGPNSTWILANASDPASVALSERRYAAGARRNGEPRPRRSTFHLLDAMAYDPQSLAGHKIYVRGLLIRLPSEQRLTISAVEPIAPGCGK